MKVKIAYTVDDSQVTSEVAKFLNEVERRMCNNNEKLSAIANKLRVLTTIKELDHCLEGIHLSRVELTNLDLKLADCVDVIGSYREYLTAGEEEREQATDFFEVPAAVETGNEDENEQV
tara:strand:+ start:6911 stop:7267 length:357 start_codon:yes stop_codon:yes gene_type:complete